MKRKKRSLIAAALAAALLLSACGGTAEDTRTERIEMNSESLYVKKADLPKDFILGMDVSSVLAEERSGVVYRGFDGKEQDLFLTLAQCGINMIRVRVWNRPFDAQGRGYGGGNCDVAAAAEIGRRAAEHGMKLLVDFHYSDFWADPGKQFAPKDWTGMTIEEKTDAVYSFTRESLETIRAAGAEIGMVQLGNETNGALCGEKTWFNIQSLMAAGSKAVREVCPKALVAVHFANPENAESYASYASKLDYYSLDYDVFATSYYPYWHGTLDNLAAVLGDIAGRYGKKVMVMETSYAYTPEDTDFSGNTISGGSAVVKNYPYTVQGQANAVRDVIDTVASIGGIGVVYWEGAWIAVGTDSWEENHAKWERDGSGWASSFAAEYDPGDAGKYYGGSAVDNQAFFAPDGTPLESLKLFSLVRKGNEIPVVPDALEDAHVRCGLGTEIVLPDTVEAVMSDNGRRAVPVQWELDGALAGRMLREAGVYEVSGTADGQSVRCFVTTEELNFLPNGSFEDGTAAPWELIDRGGADELGVENKALNSRDGDCNLHFWGAKSGSIDFDAEQTLADLAPGTYRFEISIQGGDGGRTEIYAYVKIDGATAASAPLSITSFNNWDTAEIRDIALAEGQTLTVGIRVRAEGAGNGAWGMIDAAALNRQG
ncbi:MAG: glycosyl hydrolase 53 family protein [Oscillospiraceae bacterium]|nr:glycosyl hydrolase 53 family protein [Oscillospiraceae bacterium]